MYSIERYNEGVCHVAACYIDLALVVDCSGSIRKANTGDVDNWQLVIDFMIDLVKSINVGEDETHVGVVSFGALHFNVIVNFWIIVIITIAIILRTIIMHWTGIV